MLQMERAATTVLNRQAEALIRFAQNRGDQEDGVLVQGARVVRFLNHVDRFVSRFRKTEIFEARTEHAAVKTMMVDVFRRVAVEGAGSVSRSVMQRVPPSRSIARQAARVRSVSLK